jgi:hypothetical protein
MNKRNILNGGLASLPKSTKRKLKIGKYARR